VTNSSMVRSDAQASEDGADVEDVLDTVQRSVLQLLDQLPSPPEKLRVHAANVALELEWPSTGTVVQAAPVVPQAVAEDTAPEVHQVCAPSVGTFYRASGPGARPFVSEGDLIRVGQQVAIVEAMKLMLPVESDRAGRVVEVLKGDGEPVEYGEPLITLAPVEKA
jgi:acetyl-CoA carboxylase biotin carboxyl carrier protein